MDFDYNTQRNHLVLPEYGRNIQKMVEYIINVEDRDERNRLAKAIIGVMGNMNPHLRDISDFTHKLWDHMAIMSDFQLDIDSPYETPTRSILTEKPKIIEYNLNEIKYKHYGRVIEKMINKAVEMEEGEEKEELIRVIANHMKKSYLTWNKDVVEDDVILNDLYNMSGKKLKIHEDIKLNTSKDLINKGKRRRNMRRK